MFITLKILWLCHWPDSYCMAFLCWRCTAITSRAENAHGSCLISLCTDTMSLEQPCEVSARDRGTCAGPQNVVLQKDGKSGIKTSPSGAKVDTTWNLTQKKGPGRQFSTKCSQLRKHRSWLALDKVTSWVWCVPLPICLPFSHLAPICSHRECSGEVAKVKW